MCCKNFVFALIIVILSNGFVHAMKRKAAEGDELLEPDKRVRLDSGKLQCYYKCQKLRSDGAQCTHFSTRRDAIKQHQDLHNDPNAIKCNECDFLAQSLRSVNIHRSNHAKQLNQSQTSESFKSSEESSDEYKQKTNNAPYYETFYGTPGFGSKSSQYLRYLLKKDKNMLDKSEALIIDDEPVRWSFSGSGSHQFADKVVAMDK